MKSGNAHTVITKPLFEFDRVISVCSAKDLSVWGVTASQLKNFINAVEFVVIVPETDLEHFQSVTPDSIKVINEKKYTDQIHKLLKPKFNDQNKSRYGWYLQQFIKLIALSEAKSDETYLICDADTLPLKPLVFNSSNKLSYYKATEHHLPYFETIDRLLGLKKIVSHSFIAQCFPARGIWIQEFITFIETRKGLPWLEAIVEATNFREGSGFSEYETLGTFFSHKYANEICFTNRKWLRFGNSLIGGIDKLDQPLSKLLLRQFDYAAFEAWDNPSKRRSIYKTAKALIKSFSQSILPT
jgi:hypothetical protein